MERKFRINFFVSLIVLTSLAIINRIISTDDQNFIPLKQKENDLDEVEISTPISSNYQVEKIHLETIGKQASKFFYQGL